MHNYAFLQRKKAVLPEAGNMYIYICIKRDEWIDKEIDKAVHIVLL